MRLSDAIAMGRTLVPEMKAVDLTKCALGMAGYAKGLDMVIERYVAIEAEWPWLKKPGQGCKCGYGANSGLFDIIHRFDYHVMSIGDWTLDQLIDWVRSVEPAEPTEAQAEQDAKEVLQREIEFTRAEISYWDSRSGS